jgi:hypothetical protein
MAEQIYFGDDPFPSYIAPKPSPATFTKPSDNFTVPPVTPNTVFYLAIIKPHIDSHEIIGPAKEFKHLLPKIQDIVSNSPRAIDKLDELQHIEDIWGEREKNTVFEQDGFDCFICEGQRGVYTVLKIIREVDAQVYENLPAPVYTIVTCGPLKHAPLPPRHRTTAPKAVELKPAPKGYAATTRVVGSFVERNLAQEAAREAMTDLVLNERNVNTTENWTKGGKGAGVLIAMNPEFMWEVKVVYEDEVHRRAMEGLERESVGAKWR